MNGWRETAKFAAGAEAFHALAHAALGSTGATLSLFGITFGPDWHVAGVIINASIAILLGVYAWGSPSVAPGDRAAGSATRI